MPVRVGPPRAVSAPGADEYGAAADRVQAAIGNILRRAAASVEEAARRAITSGGRSGTVERRGDHVHQASAPGEPPAGDTGQLADSIRVVTDGTAADDVQVEAGAPYAGALELGTSTMAPRPFLVPALTEVAPRLRQDIRNAVCAALRGPL